MLVAGWLAWKQGRGWLRAALSRPRAAAMLAVSGTLIAFNWGLYVWAVNAGHVIETSLGYFINPLLNVVIGVAFLCERLTRVQWIAVAFALVGVAWLTWQYGRLPWIALGPGAFVRSVRTGAQAGGGRSGGRTGRGERVPVPAGTGGAGVVRDARRRRLLRWFRASPTTCCSCSPAR